MLVIKNFQDIVAICEDIYKEAYKFKESCILCKIYPIIQREYISKIYAWYNLEAKCDVWYMDIFHLWEHNYFYLLFDDSTPHYVENIMEGSLEQSPEKVMTTIF